MSWAAGRGQGPPWWPGTHTLRGSIPGADDGREEPSPGGGGAGSKPFTALWGDQKSKGGREEKGSFKNHSAHRKPSVTSPLPAYSRTPTAQSTAE